MNQEKKKKNKSELDILTATMFVKNAHIIVPHDTEEVFIYRKNQEIRLTLQPLDK